MEFVLEGGVIEIRALQIVDDIVQSDAAHAIVDGFLELRRQAAIEDFALLEHGEEVLELLLGAGFGEIVGKVVEGGHVEVALAIDEGRILHRGHHFADGFDFGIPVIDLVDDVDHREVGALDDDVARSDFVVVMVEVDARFFHEGQHDRLKARDVRNGKGIVVHIVLDLRVQDLGMDAGIQNRA